MALWAQGFQTTKRNKRIKHLLGPCRFTRQFFLQLKIPKGWPHNNYSRLPDDEKINSDGMYSVIFTQFFMENFFKSGMDFFFEGGAGEPFLGPFIVGSPRVLFDGFWFWPFFHHHFKSREPSWICVIFHGQFSRAQFCPFNNHPSPCIHDWGTMVEEKNK